MDTKRLHEKTSARQMEDDVKFYDLLKVVESLMVHPKRATQWQVSKYTCKRSIKSFNQLTDGLNLPLSEGVPEGNVEWDGTSDCPKEGKTEGKIWMA
jgi:hypothetical protein